ncbi:MAG: DUF2059 domain-containing protein [Hyphomicrobiales bacterium]|uniref:DUF2059 domain-containing protein n=1 Tax=Rhabdaerophilum calidifontis TaxID=2604328 RepID=UPI00123BB4A1|nr:DUF2059 domain-containing protein [Rhabdaerophilum calidifontis]MCA1999263.1 DUF2059 domain-containing protein [Hyphomicrobiales bacterium]
MSNLFRPVAASARALLAALAIAAAPLAAFAQQSAITTQFEKSHVEIAGAVLRASGLTQVFQNSQPDVVGGIRVNITRQRPELARDIEEALKVVQAETAKLSNDGVTAAARFLAARLTEAELKEINTFLMSPAGKKYVETLPVFMEEFTPFLEAWNQEVQGKLVKLFQDEMAKRGHKL